MGESSKMSDRDLCEMNRKKFFLKMIVFHYCFSFCASPVLSIIILSFVFMVQPNKTCMYIISLATQLDSLSLSIGFFHQCKKLQICLAFI